jgi:lipopolysaccharide export system ATP-binding protein
MPSIKKFRILKFKSKPILTAKGISKSINKRVILRKIDFEINKGEIFGLLGPNGAGKSVTFNVLLGIMKADHGNVYVEGTRITDHAIHERAKKFRIGYIPQNDSIFKGLSCENNLKAIAEITIKDKVEQESIVQKLLSEFNLSHLRNVIANNLSGGERKKLVIARALVNNPKILLMDEPYGAVDPINIDMIKKIIIDLQKKGVSVLITDHSAQNVLSIVDRCSIISGGEIVTSGKPKEIIHDKQARQLYFGEHFSVT